MDAQLSILGCEQPNLWLPPIMDAAFLSDETSAEGFRNAVEMEIPSSLTLPSAVVSSEADARGI